MTSNHDSNTKDNATVILKSEQNIQGLSQDKIIN